MDKRVQKRLKRDALDDIMKNNPTLDNFLNKLTEGEKPEVYDMVKASMKDALEKSRMTGVKIGYIGALLWVKNRIERDGLDKTMNELDLKVTNLASTIGVKKFYDMESEEQS